MAEENIARTMWLEKELRSAKNDIRLWPEWMKKTGKVNKLPPMKKLIFGRGLLLPTLRQNKKITIRKFRKEAHDFIEGETFIGVFQDGLNIILVATKDTVVKTFNKLTDKEAQEDGYKNAKDAFKKLKKGFYPDLKQEDTAAVIRYEILQIDKTLVVSANEFMRGK